MKSVIKGRSQIGGTIIIDRKRMEKALASEVHYPPAGMTREQTIEYIENIGKNNADDTSGRK